MHSLIKIEKLGFFRSDLTSQLSNQNDYNMRQMSGTQNNTVAYLESEG